MHYAYQLQIMQNEYFQIRVLSDLNHLTYVKWTTQYIIPMNLPM